MKKVILYSRVSSTQQAEQGSSIDNQITRLKQYAELKEYQNIIVLTDAGISGKSVNRPAFLQLIELVKRNEVEAVIVYSLSRFARSIVDTVKMIELLNKHSVAFHSLSESIDTSSAVGRFFINVLSSLNQLEREQIGERTKAVLQYKKSQGAKVGQVPFGFTDNNGRLIKNKTEQNTMSIINSLRDNSYSFQDIADELIKRNRKNKAGNSIWNKSMIWKLYNRTTA